MGGSAGKIISPVARGLGDVATFGTNELVGNPIGNAAATATGGQNSYGAGSIYGTMFGSPSAQAAYNNFSIDPNQSANDQAAINNLGQSQYNQMLGGIDTNAAAQNQAAANFFQASLPDIAENAQAAHLYDSTGYGQEVARQQAALANQVSSQTAQEKLGALGGLQGVQTGALQRGLSLEDFTNQANVAKAIGAQMAPQPASGKQNFGTVASGVGALSPFAKLGKAGGAGAGAAAAGGGAAAAIPAATDALFLA